VLVAQSCLTLCDLMDCSPPGYRVHEIFQARILEWVAISFSIRSRGEKERYKHLNAEFKRIARRDKKAFLSEQCKEIRGKQQNGKD